MTYEPKKEQYAFAMLDHNSAFVQYGLTKREYFAGMVIQGLLANKPPHIDRTNYGAGVEQTRKNIKEFVEHGINIADELLKQLEK